MSVLLDLRLRPLLTDLLHVFLGAVLLQVELEASVVMETHGADPDFVLAEDGHLETQT